MSAGGIDERPRGGGALPVAAAVIGFALGYVVPGFARLPNLYYDPLGRTFLLGERPGPIPMGYLGQVAWGCLGAAIAGLVTAAAARWRGRSWPSDSQITLATAWALTALGLVGAWFTWNNWP